MSDHNRTTNQPAPPLYVATNRWIIVRLFLTGLILVALLGLMMWARQVGAASEDSTGPTTPPPSATYSYYSVPFWQQATCYNPRGYLVGTIKNYGYAIGQGLELRVNGVRKFVKTVPTTLYAAPAAPNTVPAWYVSGYRQGWTLKLTALDVTCRVGPLQ